MDRHSPYLIPPERDWLVAQEAKQNFEKVFGKPVERWLNTGKDLDLRNGKCDTEDKQKALARVIATNVNIDGWNGKL